MAIATEIKTIEAYFFLTSGYKKDDDEGAVQRYKLIHQRSLNFYKADSLCEGKRLIQKTRVNN